MADIEWVDGYKVIRDDLSSWRTAPHPLQYEIGQTTERPEKCGPLAIFETANDAKNYLRNMYGRIFRCKYVPSEDKQLWANEQLCSTLFPTGTVFADKLMLLEEIIR